MLEMSIQSLLAGVLKSKVWILMSY